MIQPTIPDQSEPTHQLSRSLQGPSSGDDLDRRHYRCRAVRRQQHFHQSGRPGGFHQLRHHGHAHSAW